ncbi:11025_t:CDS:2 [Paraglomus brasilianum]|uniref:11025_t:CDS:1 n=1 Tax=Paraglomus brasilianum TaxID=144538 RepID=A0A9N9DQV7_9GLOM|nr:11025_t:CDS:2 [Paraglomus brasilianum]
MATELVASYMSLCYYISNTHESVMIDYPSDPVLAKASTCITSITNNTNKSDNAGIEKVATKPFIALYKQLGTPKASFDIPSPDYITRNISKNLEELEQQEASTKPRTRANTKRIRKLKDRATDIGSVNLSKHPRSDATITMSHIHYQTAF